MSYSNNLKHSLANIFNSNQKQLIEKKPAEINIIRMEKKIHGTALADIIGSLL